MKNYKLFNIVFWSAYFIYEWLANASVGSEYYRYLINALVIVPITLLASVVAVHICFKQLYLKDRKIACWIVLGMSVILFTLARRFFNYNYTYTHYFPEAREYPFLFLPKLIIEGVSIYLVVCLYAMFYFVRAWYEQQRVTQDLEQKKTQAELQLLRSQVQPHFIFNTLNNIYSYALQKNENVPNLIHRLSSFLSYNLYDTRSNNIDLAKELEYINSYIELEKLRYGDRLDVSMNVYHPIDGFQVSPLLLLPIVENCFKHGFVSSLASCWLRIDVYLQHGWLTITIENSRSDTPLLKQGHKNGLGIENVRRRLAMLYPGKHEFTCVEEVDSFLTVLKIKGTDQ